MIGLKVKPAKARDGGARRRRCARRSPRPRAGSAAQCATPRGRPRSMMTPMRAIQRSVRRAAGAPEGRGGWTALGRTPMPSAAQAVYRALIVLAEKRLNEMDEQEGEN